MILLHRVTTSATGKAGGNFSQARPVIPHGNCRTRYVQSFVQSDKKRNTMMQDDIGFVVQRARQDRRNGELREPPYMTSEGMVLVDRRSHEDRRTDMMESLLGGVDLHTFISGNNRR
jgi:hypothetical protein